MQIPDLDPHFPEIIRQVFRHFFGQGCHQYPFISLHPSMNFAEQIIDLPLAEVRGVRRPLNTALVELVDILSHG